MAKRETIGIYVDAEDMEFALRRHGVHSVDSVIYGIVIPAVVKAYAERDSGVLNVTVLERTYPTQQSWERRKVVEIEPIIPTPEEIHEEVLKQIHSEHGLWEGIGLLKSGGQGQLEKTLEYGNDGRIT